MKPPNESAPPTGAERGELLRSGREHIYGSAKTQPRDCRDVFAEAKACYTIQELWKMLRIPGQPPQPGQKFSSPLRPDRNPNCQISKCGKWFSDWSQGRHLDAPAFVKEALQCSWPEVREWLIERLGIDRCQSCPPATPKKPATVAIQWPGGLHAGNPGTWAAFAESRRLTLPSVEAAVEAGLLRFTVAEGHPCFVLTDAARIGAEIRRCDDGVFRRSGGKQYPLSGVNKSWPVGTARLAQAEQDTGILVTEGPTDLLAALSLYDAYLERGGVRKWQPVAILGAGCKRLHPEAIPWFRGRRVRLVPDGDKAGDRMAQLWTDLLTPLGCDLDVIDMPRGRDLRDIAVKIQSEELFE